MKEIGDLPWLVRCSRCHACSSCSCSACRKDYSIMICPRCRNTGLDPTPLSEIYGLSEEIFDIIWEKIPF